MPRSSPSISARRRLIFAGRPRSEATRAPDALRRRGAQLSGRPGTVTQDLRFLGHLHGSSGGTDAARRCPCSEQEPRLRLSGRPDTSASSKFARHSALCRRSATWSSLPGASCRVLVIPVFLGRQVPQHSLSHILSRWRYRKHQGDDTATHRTTGSGRSEKRTQKP